MDFRKLYVPSFLNSFQFIALTGVLMSAAAHLLLRFGLGRVPAGFGWLYWCWLGLYSFGAWRNLFGKPGDGHHH